jgi:hypothetical protein
MVDGQPAIVPLADSVLPMADIRSSADPDSSCPPPTEVEREVAAKTQVAVAAERLGSNFRPCR